MADELAVVGRDNTGAFLAAVLQRVKAELRERGRVGVAEHAKHAALFAQVVAVGIVRRIVQVSIGVHDQKSLFPVSFR